MSRIRVLCKSIGPQIVCNLLFSPSKMHGSIDSSRVDEEHRLIARYAARLAADANEAVRNQFDDWVCTREIKVKIKTVMPRSFEISHCVCIHHTYSISAYEMKRGNSPNLFGLPSHSWFTAQNQRG